MKRERYTYSVFLSFFEFFLESTAEGAEGALFLPLVLGGDVIGIG